MADLLQAKTEKDESRTERALAIPVHRAQLDFLRSDAMFRGYVGGRGAGKTFITIYDLLKRAKRNRLYFVVSPTVATGVKDTTFPTFKQVCHLAKRSYYVRESDFRGWFQTADGGKAWLSFRSTEDPESLRGPSVTGIILDEASLMPHAAFQVGIACLREVGERGWMSLGFTPKGKGNWTYKELTKLGAALIQSRMVDNPFLSPEYVAAMRQRYGSGNLAKQELEGNFVDFSSMFEVNKLAIVEAVPANAKRVRYWDKSYSGSVDADWTVGVLMAQTADGLYWVEDIVRGQWDLARRDAIIRETAERDQRRYGHVRIWIEQEPGPGKEAAAISIRGLAGFSVQANPVAGKKKEIRAEPFAAQVGAGNVRMLRASWNDEFTDELMSFPGGDHDDQVDAAGGAFSKLALQEPGATRRPVLGK